MTAPQTPPVPTIPAATPPPSPSDTPSTEGGDTTTAATEPTGTEAAATPPADEWENFDAERAKQTILNQRKAEAKLKAELAAERAKVGDFERAQMSELEKVQADLEAARAEAADARKSAADLAASQAFDAAARDAGINPKALAAARTIAADVATTDESGNMIVDETLFASMKAEHEYLFTPQQAAPPRVTFGAALSQGHGGTPTSLTPEQVAFAQRAGVPVEDFAKHAARKQ